MVGVTRVCSIGCFSKLPHWRSVCGIHSVKKVLGIGHSKSPLKEIVKSLFDAKFAPLSSILMWSSSQCLQNVGFFDPTTFPSGRTTCKRGVSVYRLCYTLRSPASCKAEGARRRTSLQCLSFQVIFRFHAFVSRVEIKNCIFLEYVQKRREADDEFEAVQISNMNQSKSTDYQWNLTYLNN